MEEVLIYIDVLFVFNFIINLILLYLTGIVTGQKLSFWRTALGSSIGSAYLCVLFLSDYNFSEHIVFQLLISVFMIFCVFHCRKIKEFLKLLIIYYLMNFMLAGGIQFSAGFLPRNSMKITLLAVISGLFLLLTFGELYFGIVKKNIVQKEKQISLYYNGKQLTLTAFPDTGNTLTEPLEHMGVIVVKAEKLKDFVSFSQPETVKNLRLIPCSTVTEQAGLLYGFKPDRIVCDQKQIRAVVALSDTLQLEDYDAIINPLILV